MNFYEERRNRLISLANQGVKAQQLAIMEFLSIRQIYYYIGKKTGRHKPGRYESREFCECGNKTMERRNICRQCYNKIQNERKRLRRINDNSKA